MTVNYLKKYDPYIKRLATRYAKVYNENYNDLYQEGALALIEVANIVNKGKSIFEIEKFIRSSIKWGMLTYVVNNSSDVGMNKNKFFEGERTVNVEQDDGQETGIVLTGSNPEDLYILFEDKSLLDTVIEKFEESLDNDRDKFVWFNVVKTDTPLTTREAAEKIGALSNKTITNIRRNLEERFHNLYTGGNDVQLQ